uniref:cytochrome P450 CYP749A22-like n=1 Tax=Erigeron canadensis TaxID=72917 RepID=UPI001CB938D3|nr:cytochrome P450 CYP749A22-like [Erigeron canadensis]
MVISLGILMIGIMLSSIVIFSLMKFFHKFWWVPMRIAYVMRSQGIRGPPHSFIHGNKNEISIMRSRSMNLPMDISHHIFPRIQPHFDSWFQLYGKNFVYWVGPQAELVVTEPEFLKECMSNREISMGILDIDPISLKIIGGGGIVLSEGDKWANQRKIANHAFHAERLKNMVPVMIESVAIMLKRWQDAGDKEVDVLDEFRILSSDVISRTAFGSSYEEGKQVFQLLRDLFVLVGKNFYKTQLPGLGKVFKSKEDVESDKMEATIRDQIMQIITSKEKTLVSGEEDKSSDDYLGLLLKAYHDEMDGSSYKLSIQDIIDDCKTIHFAAHQTTTLLLSWATLLLGVHTDWQEKARDEVQEVFGDDQQNLTSEGISKLKIMGMIINETLRLYPPGVFVHRKVWRQTKVGNYVLPANIKLHIPVLALHHDPKIWGEDAHLFKPERFSEGISKATNNNPGAFLPFGYGPRYCVGSNFVMNEAKITLSMILRRYRFAQSPNYVHSPVQEVMLQPKFGVKIMIQPL